MSRRLARSAGLIGLATFASRILGLVRDQVQAYYFATGHEADAFGVATRIPTLLRDLFAEGAMSAAFVPTFTRYLSRGGKPAAWAVGARVINALILITGVVVLLGFVFARPIASSFASDYADVPGKLELTTTLMRVNAPFLILVAIAAVFMGMLNGLHRFFVPALAPAMYNVAFIACAVIGIPWFRQLGIEPAMALSAGMLTGGLAQIAIQWPLLRREGYRHIWSMDLRDPALREVLILMGPGSIGVAAAQINMLVNTQLATHEAGGVAALQYAFRLMYMPVGIIGVSVATASIPSLAQHAADERPDAMRETLSWALRMMLMLSVPAMVGLMVLASPTVELIFQHGPRWGALDTERVAGALMFYAPGIVGYSIVKIASPSFYALRDARTPVMASLVSVAANLVLNIVFVNVMGFRGLALGTALAAIINAGLLLFLLSRRLGGIDGPRVAGAAVRIVVASMLMGAAVSVAVAGLRSVVPGSSLLARLTVVSGGVGTGLVSIAAAAYLLRIAEFRDALRRFGLPDSSGPH